MWTLMLAGLFGSAVLASDFVGVSGSTTQFATTLESQIADKPVKLVLTGVAMRKKVIINVYAIGSYVRTGAAVQTAEELAMADTAKQLHLVMEREVDSKDMAAAFQEAVRRNYPAPEFAHELNTLAEFIQATTVKKGDHVWLTHLPGVGLHVRLAGKTEILIKNVRFANAVWEIYLGKNNLGPAIKQGLTSRL
ncbi:MAG: chalcone isomerase family protein [Gemmataceae bacterium]|nr:chalcone isomerase family protein [Gemmataceae bacterium]